MESAESANSAIRCSTQTQLNRQFLISAKSHHSLKCLNAHEGLVTHAQKIQIVIGHLLCYYAPGPNRRGIKRCFCLMSDVCIYLSVAYIGPNLRTERPRKIKIGTEVTHVTRDSDTTCKVKGQRSRSPDRFTQRGLNA